MDLLIAEDDKILLESYREILRPMGLRMIPFSSGNEAKAYIQTHHKDIGIFIIDLNLADSENGMNLVKLIKNLSKDSIVIIQTGNRNPETIIEAMKGQIFDYLVKPFSVETILAVLQRAIEHLNTLSSLKDSSESMIHKLQDYIEWMNYKESNKTKEVFSSERKLIYNLKTSLSHGKGIGSTISLIDIIHDTVAESQGSYAVPSEIMDLLFENNEENKRILNGMENILEILDSGGEKKATGTSEILERLKLVAEKIRPLALKKNVTIKFSEFRECLILVDTEKVHIALEELLINAVKYATHGTKVQVMHSIVNGYSRIFIKNQITPKEAETLAASKSFIGNPFYRAHPPTDEIIRNEKFSIGSGIMAVEFIIKNNSGIFTMQTQDDYTGNIPGKCVISEVLFQTIKE